ncbi:MAG TPA: Uma2 family endonuclease [Verrucomicrobiae bacterium]
MAERAIAQYLTEVEYFALEEKSDIKHEYFGGEVFAMAGGTYNHSLIVSNLNRHLGILLRGKCKVTAQDLRLKVEATGLLAYPDVSVVCGKPTLLHPPADTLVNPTLIGEVLSSSTEHYGRTFKFDQYKQIPSLSTYIVVSQYAPHVEQYVPKPDFWEYTSASSLEGRLELLAFGVTIELSEIYLNVEFETMPGGFRLPIFR